jgi:hypothetical protein
MQIQQIGISKRNCSCCGREDTIGTSIAVRKMGELSKLTMFPGKGLWMGN